MLLAVYFWPHRLLLVAQCWQQASVRFVFAASCWLPLLGLLRLNAYDWRFAALSPTSREHQKLFSLQASSIGGLSQASWVSYRMRHGLGVFAGSALRKSDRGVWKIVPNSTGGGVAPKCGRPRKGAKIGIIVRYKGTDVWGPEKGCSRGQLAFWRPLLCASWERLVLPFVRRVVCSTIAGKLRGLWIRRCRRELAFAGSAAILVQAIRQA